MMWNRYDNVNGMMDGWFWLVIFWIVIIAVVIGIIVFLIVMVTRNSHGRNQTGQVSQDRSLQLLNERLAKGEITLEEYNSIKEALTKDK